jgi:methionine synthase I (cobalamin-dependent)
VPSLQALAAAGADAVGMNCSVTSPVMLEMVRQAAPVVGASLIAQPNAGHPRPTTSGVVYDADPAPFAADVIAMLQAGARMVGGCCGTDDAFIAAVRTALAG